MVKIMENPIKMDDLGVPLFSETSIYILIYICTNKMFYNMLMLVREKSLGRPLVEEKSESTSIVSTAMLWERLHHGF